MKKTFDDIMADAKRVVPEVRVDEVRGRLAGNGRAVVILDVREKEEYREGHLPGAISIPRGFLEMKMETEVPERDAEIIAYCQGGTRSLMAGVVMKEMGYTNVVSMTGGFGSWKQAGNDWSADRQFTPDQLQRYSRHFILPEVGEAGQSKLLDAKVLLIGAGGLGSPTAYYLAAAGVGTLGIVDDDVVDRSNLQRQILHTDDRVGMPKIESAELTLKGLNPDLNVIGYRERVDSSNVKRLFEGYDIIVDGCDNFPTRYLVNDACVFMNKPNVHGSIFQFEGQTTVFDPASGPCYRCLFPEPPPPGAAPSCQEAGVLGVLPGLIGSVQAVETLKLILGIGNSLVGRLLHFDTLSMDIKTLKLRKDPECPVCGDQPTVTELIDYEEFCGLRGDDAGATT
ncbi:MAG: molybdopterin-synthase adenylyltransferase MoeB [Candidatus Binatia bacterium]|nr:molybdopterin-synthase adenylyltransferase MoeB [Candidatus Binatia bacterium]